jgi:hypothetical protein
MLIGGKVFWLCSRSQAGVILLMNIGEERQPSFLGFGKQVQLKVMKNLAIRRGTNQCLRFDANTGSEQRQQRST